MDQIARFWNKVNKTDNCWLWKAKGGYGRFMVQANPIKFEGAHRFSWQLHYGPIPEDSYVLHRCDTPSCVRPDHLFLGTQVENALDCQRKGRGFSRRTHCVNGHEFTASNTISKKIKGRRSVSRSCRICHYAEIRRRENRSMEQHHPIG